MARQNPPPRHTAIKVGCGFADQIAPAPPTPATNRPRQAAKTSPPPPLPSAHPKQARTKTRALPPLNAPSLPRSPARRAHKSPPDPHSPIATPQHVSPDPNSAAIRSISNQAEASTTRSIETILQSAPHPRSRGNSSPLPKVAPRPGRCDSLLPSPDRAIPTNHAPHTQPQPSAHSKDSSIPPAEPHLDQKAGENGTAQSLHKLAPYLLLGALSVCKTSQAVPIAATSGQSDPRNDWIDTRKHSASTRRPSICKARSTRRGAWSPGFGHRPPQIPRGQPFSTFAPARSYRHRHPREPTAPDAAQTARPDTERSESVPPRRRYAQY